MAKDDAGRSALHREGPFALRETPLDVDGGLDLSAWLPAPAAPTSTAPAAAPTGAAPGAAAAGDPLPALAVEVWRLKERLVRLGELVAGKELRPVESAVAKMQEVLAGAAVELDDPKGRPFHEGEPLEVLLFEPTPGLSRPTVLQTVKPGVRVGGRLVRRAEVVVGTPADKAGAP